jgi:hypothetical protein
MPKNKQKTKTAIYHPPKKGMPYLVVTVSPEGVVAIAVESKDEARVSSNPNGLGRRPFSCYPLAQPALVWGIARLVRPGHHLPAPPAACRAASLGEHLR